jgi:hypothetical protein
MRPFQLTCVSNQKEKRLDRIAKSEVSTHFGRTIAHGDHSRARVSQQSFCRILDGASLDLLPL